MFIGFFIDISQVKTIFVHIFMQGQSANRTGGNRQHFIANKTKPSGTGQITDNKQNNQRHGAWRYQHRYYLIICLSFQLGIDSKAAPADQVRV
jgi:hypothetical protein